MAGFGSSFAATNAGHNPNKDVEVVSPPTDGVSSLNFSPTTGLLCATSWDNQVGGSPLLWQRLLSNPSVWLPVLQVQQSATAESV